MNCPVCQSEMEAGFLQGGNRIAWVKKPHKVSLLPREGELLLENNMFASVVFPASICKACRKIVVDYSGKSARER